MELSYEVVGRGADVALAVTGRDLAACLTAAVRGFAATFVSVPPGVRRRTLAVVVDDDAAADALVALLEYAIVRLDAYGEVAVDAEVTGEPGTLAAALDVVALEDVEVTGAAPKAVTWNDLVLEERGGRWEGFVVLDL